MSSKITGKEYPLLKIFSSDFEYHIPAYQRPYAWTTEEASILFDDLYQFYRNELTDNYFLGSIVLIKDDSDPYSEVIDGQQRLTTLSILFSVMANRFEGDLRTTCKEYLQEKGNVFAGIEAKPRLFLREREQDFFNKYIQNVDFIDLLNIDPKNLDTESKRHIQSNCKVFYDKFNEAFSTEKEVLEFSQFLLNRCFLVAVYTPNQESAFRVFSVMNSRGLDLLPTDIVKSDIIGRLAHSEQNKYTTIWEDLENLTGRDGFNEVFTHTRTIFAKEKAKKNLLDEFREYVVNRVTPKSLIDDYLVPYTNAYIKLKNSAYSSTQYADEINNILYWLNKTNNYDWMPSAIKFLADHPNDSAYTYWFVKKLERLASFMLVTSKDVNHRMERYRWVLVEMESNPTTTLEEPLKNVELTEWEKKEFIAALNGEIYTMTSQRRNYIIQRLDSFVSDGGAIYNNPVFTIEHVFPQNPDDDSQWIVLWPNVQQRKFWLNRIANLVPLTRQKNSSAQNYDFETKKVKYFQTKSGTTSYALTTQVLNINEWTPEVVEQRQKELINIFVNRWDLSPSDIEIIDDSLFHLAGRGGNASGYWVDAEHFIVKSGSVISDSVTEGSGYMELRNRLCEEGIIVNREFVKDYSFTSVSAAAAVILGRTSNGRREWTKIDGRSIAET